MTITNSVEKIMGTTQQLANRWGCDYAAATGFIKLLKIKGIASEKLDENGKPIIIKPEGHRGKGATVYEIPQTITLSLA